MRTVLFLFSFLWACFELNAQNIQYKYDKAGRLSQQTYSSQNTRVYTYDKDGNRIGQKDTTCIIPVANFAASVISGNCPLTVNFINNSTYTGSASWEWIIYKDSSSAPLISTSQSPSITYNSPGSFLVLLKVTDGCGSDTQAIPAYITVTCPCTTPIAKFGASQTIGNCPLTVDFFDSSLTLGSAKYGWKFYTDSSGIPLLDTAKTPVGIVYNKAGTFNVELIITDSCGLDTQTSVGYITVICLPANILENQKEGSIKVYPNPTYNIVSISGESIRNGNYKIEVSNILGQSLQHYEIATTNSAIDISISLKQYPSGSYFITIDSGIEIQTFQISKK